MQFRRPAEASGCPGRRPVLAGGDTRPPGCPHRGAGPTQVGPGPIRQINNLHKSQRNLRNEAICLILFLACPNGDGPCSEIVHALVSPPTSTKNSHGGEESNGVTWHGMQGELQGKG